VKISRVIIKNYRNFKSFDIDLKESTLVIGENNIGKTNLLTALGLIFSQDISFYKRRMLEVDDINFDAISEFKRNLQNLEISAKDIVPIEVKVEVYISDFLGNSRQEAIVADWLIDESLSIAKLTYSFSVREDLTDWINEIRQLNTTVIDFPISKYDYTIYGGLDETKQVDFYFLKMLKFEFLDALRDARTQLIASGNYRLFYKILKNLGDGKFEDIKSILKDLKEGVDNNDVLRKLKSDISQFLDKTSLVEHIDHNKIEFEFSKVEENEILQKLSVIYGNAPVTVERNGLGRNNILYMSLVLSHLISKEDDNTGFRIIAIEEPEAHLHPHLQEHFAKSIQSLTNAKVQIIITSHSTHITSKLDLKNTVIVFKDKEKNITTNHYLLNNFANAKGKIDAEAKHSISYLSRFLDATKSTMFFARKLIFVEGIAEQTLIPIFYQRINNKPLEKDGITIVNVNGLAFEHFLKILKNGYYLKCLVLTDSDAHTKQRDRADNLRAKFADYNEIVKIQTTAGSTFEIDMINENKNSKDLRDTILKAIKLTRPNAGGQGFAENFHCHMDTNSFFNLIEPVNEKGEKNGSFKSEFASNLVEVLTSNDNKFKVPNYISEGFDFLLP